MEINIKNNNNKNKTYSTFVEIPQIPLYKIQNTNSITQRNSTNQLLPNNQKPLLSRCCSQLKSHASYCAQACAPCIAITLFLLTPALVITGLILSDYQKDNPDKQHIRDIGIAMFLYTIYVLMGIVFITAVAFITHCIRNKCKN